MKNVLDFLIVPAALGAMVTGFGLVIALLNGSENLLNQSIPIFIPCIVIIVLDRLVPDTPKTKASDIPRPKQKAKPKSLPKKPPSDLAHLKEGILKGAETTPLSYSRLMAILDNRHRFGFTDDEVKMLEESSVVGPFPEAPITPSQECPRCGGSGYIRRYQNYEGGRCFRCNPG